METAYAELREQFHKIFGVGATDPVDKLRAGTLRPGAAGSAPVRVVRAPGRVNLIGEHTDYNDGFVLPMAIEPQVLFAARAREDGLVRLASTAFAGQVVEFSVQKQIAPGEPKWANYSRGVAAGLLAAGIPLVGMDALVTSTLPVGGGLSSSAAIEVGTGRALLAMVGQDMDGDRLALLCQRAEHEFAGVPVGIMDQTIVATAKAGSAMLLDCRSFSKQYIPIDPHELRVVIVNSMVSHELAAGEYAQRRHQCEEAVEFFQAQHSSIRALRDVTSSQVEAAKDVLPDEVYRRCRHVVSENTRTTAASALLGQRRYEEAGILMVQSHASLRDDYEVSTPELDFLVDQAMKVRGVYGARMTGGGFGGCIVALVQPRWVDTLIENLKMGYAQRFGGEPAAYVTTATAGAGVVQ